MEKSSINFVKMFFGVKDEKNICELREKTSRKIFLFFAFLFFLSYFFIGVSFYEVFFKIIISKMYFLFVFSGAMFLFFLVKNSFKKNIFKYIFWGILIISVLFSLLPFFISKDVILNYFK